MPGVLDNEQKTLMGRTLTRNPLSTQGWGLIDFFFAVWETDTP